MIVYKVQLPVKVLLAVFRDPLWCLARDNGWYTYHYLVRTGVFSAYEGVVSTPATLPVIIRITRSKKQFLTRKSSGDRQEYP
jgi:hypothetical protein